MVGYKVEALRALLGSIAQAKSLVEGRTYEYRIEKVDFKDTIEESIRGHIIDKLQEESRNCSKNKLPSYVNAILHIKEEFSVSKNSSWKKELVRSLYIWANVKGVNVPGFNIEEIVLELIDDFIHGRDVEVWSLEDDVAGELYNTWGGKEYDDFIFVEGENIYILHFSCLA